MIGRGNGDGEAADPTVQLQARISEGWARIAADGDHADYQNHPLFEAVMGLELEVAYTHPRSVAGLAILLRQAFTNLVPFNEGTENYENCLTDQTYRAILTAIETLEGWQKAATARQPDTPAEGQG